MTLRYVSRALALGALVAVAAAGCGPNKTTSATASAPAASSSASTAADSSPPVDQPSASSSASAGGTCKAADMTETVYGGDGTAGAIYSGVQLTNKSSKACTVSGFPTISFVDDKGTAYKFTVAHAGTAATKFSVAAGGKAYFTIKLSTVPTSSGKQQGPCDPPAAAMRISLAGDGSDYATDKGPWHACGSAMVGPLTAKPDPNMHK
jgi:hypothetical protein